MDFCVFWVTHNEQWWWAE